MLKKIKNDLCFIVEQNVKYKVSVTDGMDFVYFCLVDEINDEHSFDFDRKSCLITVDGKEYKGESEEPKERIKHFLFSDSETEMNALYDIINEKQQEINQLRERVKENASKSFLQPSSSQTRNPISGASLLNPRAKRQKKKDIQYDSD